MSPADVPRAAVQALLAAKFAQRVALEAEIAALQALPLDEAPDTVLALYCALTSAKTVVSVVDALGWRLPGQKGPRRWQREDVYSLVTEDNTPASPVLRAMARERLQGRQLVRPFAGWSV